MSWGVECPIVRASKEHCFTVRVLRAQGVPPIASRFLSPPKLARRDSTGGVVL